jgi:ribose transport system substrate-binding protein
LLADAIDRAVDLGIPVVTWDSDAPKSKRRAFYGVNDFEAGKALGEGLARLIGGRGKVALITALGADNLQKRLEGAQEALRQFPDIEVVEVFDIRDDAVRVSEVLATGTQRYPDLAGWLSVGGWPVFLRNALDPVDTSRTKVAAFDTIPPAPDLVRAGKVHLLVGQKYFGWGTEAVRLLHRLHRGESIENPMQYSGIDLVTAENLDRYLEQWQKWEAGEP